MSPPTPADRSGRGPSSKPYISESRLSSPSRAVARHDAVETYSIDVWLSDYLASRLRGPGPNPSELRVPHRVPTLELNFPNDNGAPASRHRVDPSSPDRQLASESTSAPPPHRQ